MAEFVGLKFREFSDLGLEYKTIQMVITWINR